MYRIVDLFAGVGGLSWGFSRRPDCRVVAANELEPDIAEAYRLNYPDVPMVTGDIGGLTEEVLGEIIGAAPVDIVIGGPPCQSYSTLGRRRLDSRAGLFLEYGRVLRLLRPRAFVFENVTGILSMDGGRLFRQVQAGFEELGYTLKHQVLNAVDYGVPQLRERVILVGFLGENPFRYPAPTHGEGRRPYVTLGEAVGDLPPLKSGQKSDRYLHGADSEFLAFVRQGGEQVLTEHAAPKNGPGLIRIMEALGEGQGKNDLPEELRPKSGYGNTYAKLWWDRPATTITRNFACPSSSRCIHPRDSRAMTIREGARLQSFPDSYRFYGSDGTKRLEIGNAVPPLLSEAIAGALLEAMGK